MSVAIRGCSLLLFIALMSCGRTRRVPVVYDSREFDRFLQVQREAVSPPDLILRGRDVFSKGSCVACHAVRGTKARSPLGPDLTHVASRRTIAAGTLPNTRGNMAGWILNPQNLKEGTKMPATVLATTDLHALLAYLETLR